jgi:hypothetical protein
MINKFLTSLDGAKDASQIKHYSIAIKKNNLNITLAIW